MNYEHAFSGRTKNGYFAVCFKTKPGLHYTVVLKDGYNVNDQTLLTSEKFKVYDDYTPLTGEIFDIEPFEIAIFDYFEKIKADIELAKKIAAETKAKHLKMISSFGDNAAKIAGYCFANNIPVNRQHITNKQVKIASVKLEVNVIHDKISKRTGDKLTTDYYSHPRTKTDRIKHLFAHLSNAASALPMSGYSMGELKRIYVSDIEISRHDGRSYYSGNKWAAKHGDMSINLSVSEAKRTRVIGGFITIIGELCGRGVRKCEWFRADKGYNGLAKESGYIAGDYHFFAPSLKDAKLAASAYYAQKKQRELAERRNATALKRSDKKTWVSYDDSIKGGNCSAGTNNFANVIRFNLQSMGAIRADFLLKKATDHKVLSYAERAVKAAKMRYAGITE